MPVQDVHDPPDPGLESVFGAGQNHVIGFGESAGGLGISPPHPPRVARPPFVGFINITPQVEECLKESGIQELDFGPWEQIFYGEFDGCRRKRVLVKIIGE